MKRVDLEKFWNPLLYIDNILSETKEATWLTATVGPKQEAFVLERRRVRGIFLENLELNDFPLDVQVKSKINSLTQICLQKLCSFCSYCPFGCPIIYTDTKHYAILFIASSTMFDTTNLIF